MHQKALTFTIKLSFPKRVLYIIDVDCRQSILEINMLILLFHIVNKTKEIEKRTEFILTLITGPPGPPGPSTLPAPGWTTGAPIPSPGSLPIPWGCPQGYFEADFGGCFLVSTFIYLILFNSSKRH